MARIRSDRTAHAFHTHMVDIYSSKFRTEVFQVKYAMMDGREHHLLGLRDFTDLKSLAGENATDAIADESEVEEVEAASRASARASRASQSPGIGLGTVDVDLIDAEVSAASYQLPPESDFGDSEFSNVTLEQNDRGNGIVEKRLKYFRLQTQLFFIVFLLLWVRLFVWLGWVGYGMVG